MTIEPSRIRSILDCRESPSSPELLNQLSSQLYSIFNRSEPPVLIFPGDEPYFRYAILENDKNFSQIALEIRGTKDHELINPPNRLFIRMFEKIERKLTRVIFTLGYRGTVGSDFDTKEQLDEKTIIGLYEGSTLKIDPGQPAWYTYEFLEKVSQNLKAAYYNEELERKVVDYFTNMHNPPAQIMK